ALTSGQAYSNLNVSQDKGDACPSSTQKNYSAIQKPERPVYLRPESLRQTGRIQHRSQTLRIKWTNPQIRYKICWTYPYGQQVCSSNQSRRSHSGHLSMDLFNLACPTKPSSSSSCNNQTPAYRPVSRTTSACPLSPMNAWPIEPVI
ncbi:hypothetical protein PSHT_12786, partial [Puccinia striiformis]